MDLFCRPALYLGELFDDFPFFAALFTPFINYFTFAHRDALRVGLLGASIYHDDRFSFWGALATATAANPWSCERCWGRITILLMGFVTTAEQLIFYAPYRVC